MRKCEILPTNSCGFATDKKRIWRNRRVVVVTAKADKPSKCCQRRKLVLTKQAVACALVAVCSIVGLVWALSVLPVTPLQQPLPSYQGVIELLNVEGWEGGCGSRSAWLTKSASEFEKSHTGLYFCVTTLSAEQFAQNFANGINFDVVCFGRGVGCDLLPYLMPVDNVNGMGQNLLRSAQLDGVQYALPLYAGCYGLFCRQSVLTCEQLKTQCLTKTLTRKIGKSTVTLRPLVCGFASFNGPLDALVSCGICGKVQADYSLTQYSAYEAFVANKTAVTLLGTQRDLYRLTQKQQLGKLESIASVPLDGYTDLVQYVGINANGEKTDICNEFVQFLTSGNVQQTLTGLSLFCVTGDNYYSDQAYTLWQSAVYNCFVPNVFADKSAIDLQRQNAVVALVG